MCQLEWKDMGKQADLNMKNSDRDMEFGISSRRVVRLYYWNLKINPANESVFM